MTKASILFKLENFIAILRHQKSGAQVHKVTNLLQSALLLQEGVYSGLIHETDAEVTKVMNSVQNGIVELFK